MNVAAEITTHSMSLVAGSNVTRGRRRPFMQVRPLPSMLRAVAALRRARGGQRVIFLPPLTAVTTRSLRISRERQRAALEPRRAWGPPRTATDLVGSRARFH